MGSSLLTAAAGAVHAGLLAAGTPSLGWVFLVLLLAVAGAVGLSLRVGPIRDGAPSGTQ